MGGLEGRGWGLGEQSLCLSLDTCWGLVPGPLWTARSVGARVRYGKQCSICICPTLILPHTLKHP